MAEREGLLGAAPLAPSGPPPLHGDVVSHRSAALGSNLRVLTMASTHHKYKRPRSGPFVFGGERGIRTLDGLLTHTPLAGARLQPLGHLSKNLKLRTGSGV